MRIGVIGCGYWGSKHVRVLRSIPEVDQVVLVDPIRTRADKLAAQLNAGPTFSDIGEALPLVEAVIIATPPTTHAEMAHLAIGTGKHVLVEKPMTTSVAESEKLIELAENSSVVLMVGHTFEFNAAVWKLRELVKDGALGKLHYIDSARLNLGLYQPNVNVVWDLAPHDISIINHLLQVDPLWVAAWGSRYAHPDQEDVAFLRLEYPQLNVSAHIHVSWLDPRKVRRMTIVGSDKMAVYNDLSTDERIRVYDRGVVPPPEELGPGIPMSYRYGDIQSPYVEFYEPLLVQDQHFVDCVLGDSTPRTDGFSGLRVVRILEALDASLRLGRAVHLTPPIEGHTWQEAGKTALRSAR